MSERVKGHIKQFSRQKRHDFIKRDDGLQDVFVHLNRFRSRNDAYWIGGGNAVDAFVLNSG